MQQRVKSITHQGKEILAIDLSHASPEDFLAVIREARRVIAAKPLGSVRTLTNVTGVRYRRDVWEPLREFVQHNKPYVRAGAVVGLDALKTIMFNFINKITGRSLRAMDDEATALDWLAQN